MTGHPAGVLGGGGVQVAACSAVSESISVLTQDFFGDEMGDLAAMTEAAAERRDRHS